MPIYLVGQFFDPFHIFYIIFSILITIILLILPNKYFKSNKSKNKYLKFWGIITVFLHISPLWIDFLGNKQPIASDNMLFPIYFCNLAMYLLLITSFIENKNSKTFKYLAIITSYAGILGALISLIYPDYYIDSKMTWGVFKSMLSHSTMLIGALYLMTGKYFKIETNNAKVFTVGLLGFGFIGLLVIITFKIANIPVPNAMYLLGPALETDNKFIRVLLSGYIIGPFLILLVYSFTKIYTKIQSKYFENNLIYS